MAELNDIMGWALIGTPDGMQAKSGGCIAEFDVSNIVDIDNRYIEIFPNTELVSFFREIRQNQMVSFYILYNHAKEIKSNRPGTFYGSVLVLVNHIIDPSIAYTLLKELSNHLLSYISKENRFITNIKNIDLPNKFSINNIAPYLKPLQGNINLGTREGYFSLPGNDKNSIINFFDWVSDVAVSELYYKMFASYNTEIKQSVIKKDRYKLVNAETLPLEININQLKIENSQLLTKFRLFETEYKQNIDNKQSIIDGLNQKLKDACIQIEELRQKNHELNQSENYLSEIRENKKQIDLLEKQLEGATSQIRQVEWDKSQIINKLNYQKNQLKNPQSQPESQKKKPLQRTYNVNDFIHSKTGLLFFSSIFIGLIAIIMLIIFVQNGRG